MSVATTAVIAGATQGQAIRASGVVVHVEPKEFISLLSKKNKPLVVEAKAKTGIFSTKNQYLTPYRGLVFSTMSDEPLKLPADTELFVADKIWVPV